MQMKSLAHYHVDERFYPRADVSRKNISQLKEAFASDQPVPPIVVCEKTKIIIDGRHRFIALTEMFGKDAKWYIKEERFNDDKARFVRAAQLNWQQGLKLSPYDLSHCAAIAETIGLSTAELAAGIGVRESYVEAAIRGRFAANSGVNALRETSPPKKGGIARTPLKRSIQHMASQKLTKKQWEANEKLSGWPARFHVDQLILLIETGMLETDNEELTERLQVLHGLLDGVLAAH